MYSSCSSALVLTPFLLQNSTDPKLSGWGGIEDHLSKYDSGWAKDYADDIDTLLVFVCVVFSKLPLTDHYLVIGGSVFRGAHRLRRRDIYALAT